MSLTRRKEGKYFLAGINTTYYLIVAMVIGFAVGYTYAVSSTIIYRIVMAMVTGTSYFLFLRCIHHRTIDITITVIVFLLTVISVLNGIIREDILDAATVNLSIIVPISLCAISLRDIEDKKPWMIAYIVLMVLIFALLQFEGSDTDAWNINENSIAFWGFMALSPGFVWLKLSHKKIIPAAALIAGFLILTATKCRNVILVFPICMILALIPNRIWKNKWFFRLIVISALLYTVFAYQVLDWLFSSRYSKEIVDYTLNFSQGKRGTMYMRVSFFEETLFKIHNLPVIEKLFGQGIRGTHHTHNMCYQSLYIYGYAGTALIYIVFLRIFEMARELIVENKDVVAVSCVIVLIGHILINGADVYLLGTSCVSVVPQVFMAIIISRYISNKKKARINYET